jgi:hypothetical protein
MRAVLQSMICVLVFCVAGCSGTGPTGVNFIGDWSPTDVAAIEAGFAEWPRTAGVDVVRVTDASPPNDACPSPDLASGYLAGHTDRATSTICIYVDDIARGIAQYGRTDLMQANAAHEMGHLLGLKHYMGSAPSIMRPYTTEWAADVQAVDLRDL